MNTLALLLPALLSATSGSREEVAPAHARPAVSVLEDEAPPLPHWKGALSLGVTWTDGNSETATLSGNFNAERRGEMDRWTFDLFSNYGEKTEAGAKVVDPNNHGGGVKYDYFMSKKAYLVGNGSAKVDHVADLDLRYIVGAGFGYQWREDEDFKWGTEVGLSYVDEDFGDDSADAQYAAARIASNLSWAISKTTSFEQVAELLPSLEDSEDLIVKVDNRLKLHITGKWIAQIQYVLDFDNSTPPGVEEADHRVVLGLGWTFGE